MRRSLRSPRPVCVGLVLGLVGLACGSDDAAESSFGSGMSVTTAGDSTGDETSSGSSSTTGAGSISAGSIGSSSSDGSASGGGSSGEEVPSGEPGGTCASPQPMTLPFTLGNLDTRDAPDATDLSCGAPEALPEAVYTLVIEETTQLTMTGSDQSGGGMGVQVRSDDCEGNSVSCEWANGGNLDRLVTLQPGTWILIFERIPAGVFEIAVAG